MLDKFNRKINYLRISVTDRCNLRCDYCMPGSGVKLFPKKDILSFEEISEVVNEATKLGITKIKITGGEPLVRKNLAQLISIISSNKNIKDIGLTTNGQLLETYAKELKNNGLNRVNISLDTINPDKYKTITSFGDINKVFTGIAAAKKAGLSPIKINCVINNSFLEPDAQEVANWANNNNLEIRFISKMNLKEGKFKQVFGGDGGDCENCNRLRLTADGQIKSCLFSTETYDVRKLGAKSALIKAIENKPACGTKSNNNFYQIGG